MSVKNLAISILATTALSAFSAAAWAGASFWQFSPLAGTWYASPQEACEEHWVFKYQTNPWINPEASLTGPQGNTSPDGGHHYCFGTIPSNGVRTFLGNIRPYGCSAINPAQYGGLVCIDPDADGADKDTGAPSNCLGNPCDVGTGNKFQTELDIVSAPMSFSRYYNSNNLIDLGVGVGWRHKYQSHLVVSGAFITRVSPTGKGEPWTKLNSVWIGDADSKVEIVETAAGFDVTNADGSKSVYDSSGKLRELVDANGKFQHLIYNTANTRQLDEVVDHYGAKLKFLYLDARLVAVEDDSGAQVRYSYNGTGNLVVTVFPDFTPADDTDNPRRIYHYENMDFPNHLTGITDENGDRYSTYAYDANGKAISTEHSQTTNAVGQEKFELDFQEGGSQ